LFTISYFIGTLFYVFSNLTKDKPNFVESNFSADESDIDRLIVVIYFAFTTLTTVGYGDYHAINNQERILFSFILLFGTAVFSFIMGNFIEILMSYKDVTADNEDS
jgi:Ion channel